MVNITISLGAFLGGNNDGSPGSQISDKQCFCKHLTANRHDSVCDGNSPVNTVLVVESEMETKVLFMCGNHNFSPWNNVRSMSNERLCFYMGDDVKNVLPIIPPIHAAWIPSWCIACSDPIDQYIDGEGRLLDGVSLWKDADQFSKIMCPQCTKSNSHVSLKMNGGGGNDDTSSVVSMSGIESTRSLESQQRQLTRHIRKYMKKEKEKQIDSADNDRCCQTIMTKNFMVAVPMDLDFSAIDNGHLGDIDESAEDESRKALKADTTNSPSQTKTINYHNKNVYHGQVDAMGNPHGNGQMTYADTNTTFIGIFNHGIRDNPSGEWVGPDRDSKLADKLAQKDAEIEQLKHELETEKNKPQALFPASAMEQFLSVYEEDGYLTLTAGALVLVRPQPIFEEQSDIVRLIAGHSEEGLLFDTTIPTANDYLIQVVAHCVDTTAYRLPDKEVENKWYNSRNVSVTGTLTADELPRLRRIISCSQFIPSSVNSAFRQACVVRGPFGGAEGGDLGDAGNCFFLCDETIRSEEDGEFIDTTVTALLETSSDVRALLQHVMGNAKYFAPIRYSEANVFNIITAYDLKNWYKKHESDVSEGMKGTLKRFFEDTQDPMDLPHPKLESILAYSIAIIRLFHPCQRRKEKELACFCCSTPTELQVKIGLQAFVSPMNHGMKNFVSGDLSEILEGGEGLGTEPYADHNSVLGAACGLSNVTVENLTNSKRRAFNYEEYGISFAVFGVSVALYLFMNDPNTDFSFVVNDLAAMDIPDDGDDRDDLSEYGKEVWKAIDNSTKKGTKLRPMFKHLDMQLQFKIVKKMAQVLMKLNPLSPRVRLVAAFGFAKANHKYIAETAINEETGNTTYVPSAEDEEFETILTDMNLAEHGAGLPLSYREILEAWGKNIEEVHRLRHLLRPPVKLFLAIQQLGILKQFFYGPLEPMSLLQPKKTDVHRRLKQENLELRVAVNPNIDAQLLRMVKMAISECNIMQNCDEVFIVVNADSESCSNPHLQEMFASAFGIDRESWEYAAVNALLGQKENESA